nr:MAG TPA: hypothetical protein [Caudoviricetes sp.]
MIKKDLLPGTGGGSFLVLRVRERRQRNVGKG